ncbi:AbfB domain-containing protein [Streptomyces syringium]|uniref:AbfB domain-containing protein n=1 Tax=Streptomyces syringium TaxID=76729 RepID=UPI00345683CD
MTATALAAVAGVVAPTAAVAAPSKTVTEAGGIGTNDEQRVAAAAVVRLDPKPDVLLLSDYDFIHALWQKARDAGEGLGAVRTAAEEAMMSSTKAEDHVRFITTGIHQAYKLDQQREKDKADAERAIRLAKSQVLIAVGIPSSPDLLALSDDNFIRAIMKHDAAGPEVRSAAAKALANDAAAWREFLVNGAREAHQRDVANELKELEEKNRKEAERRKELAARTNVAALFRTTPTEAMLALGDDNFIRELLRTAPDDTRKSELYEAAQSAVLSSDPKEWKKFIHSGAEEAYKRDDEARRKKLAEENRKLARQIMGTAENSGINPGLVEAARTALAGDDAEVARFLKPDSQLRARRQSIQLSVGPQAGWYLRSSAPDEDYGFIGPLDAKSKQAAREEATWAIVPALASNPGCFSFESVRKPGYYLRGEHGVSANVRIVADDGSAKFKEEATWCRFRGFAGTGVSFQLASRDYWLRAYGGQLYATYSSKEEFNQDATWSIAPPLAR